MIKERAQRGRDVGDTRVALTDFNCLGSKGIRRVSSGVFGMAGDVVEG